MDYVMSCPRLEVHLGPFRMIHASIRATWYIPVGLVVILGWSERSNRLGLGITADQGTEYALGAWAIAQVSRKRCVSKAILRIPRLPYLTRPFPFSLSRSLATAVGIARTTKRRKMFQAEPPRTRQRECRIRRNI